MNLSDPQELAAVCTAGPRLRSAGTTVKARDIPFMTWGWPSGDGMRQRNA